MALGSATHLGTQRNTNGLALQGFPKTSEGLGDQASPPDPGTNETIKDYTISEIWNGKNYNNLREKHLSGARQKIEPCSRCVVV